MDTNKKNILFPTDFSEDSLNVLQYAVDYAKKSAANLVLIHVIEFPWKISDKLEILMAKNTSNINEIEDATRFLLHEIAGRITKSHNIKVQYKVLHGNLISALLAYINKTQPEMIIRCAKSHNNAYKIADYCPIPAITINVDSLFKEIKTILFPVNDKLYTTQKTDEIIRICGIYKANVILLGIAPNNNDGLDAMSLYMESILKTLENKGINTQIKMVIGNDYAEEIDKYTQDHNVDLISIVSNFEHGILSLFKTTPDEKLVKSSLIPVLNIPIEIDITPSIEINTEYISPWSMKYDVNKVSFPFK
ncbi:MAG: universal stress protein [Bacteroidia bacterium]